MPDYHDIIHRRLIREGWDVIAKEASGAWWAEECWVTQSAKQHYGFQLALTFLISPIAEYDMRAPRKDPVYAVTVSEDFPTERTQAENGLGLFSVRHGNLARQLDEMMELMNGLRMQENTQSNNQRFKCI